eukprot:scaffold33638_cov142-Skeletonema_dohrnii-CCMP3373.AAC.7
MERRDFNYYEANAADISLEKITSSEKNAKILRRLRDGDYNLSILLLGSGRYVQFRMGKGDDLGWLGYFIGRSVKLQQLDIRELPADEGGQQIDAFFDGLARSQSIRSISCKQLGDYGCTALFRVLGNLSQLEGLSYSGTDFTLNRNGCFALGTLLESGVWKSLKELCFHGNNIGDDGVAALASGLRSIGPFLKTLGLSNNSIGNEGLLALVTALESCTSLEELDLSNNDFSLATAELRSLSDWLQSNQMDLKWLNFESCGINDEGLQALSEGATNHCKVLDLSENNSITALGLRYLSTPLQSVSCHLENLYLGRMNIGDDGAEVLARGLIGNKSLRCLHLCDDDEDIAITRAGWSAFSAVLCDTSTVNNTYLSNHTVQELWNDYHTEEDFDIDEDIVLYLQLNKEYPQYAARCKILMNHTHLDMVPFLRWGLKCLPLAVGWFESAKPCTTLSIYEDDLSRQVLDESEEVYQSRVLTALYEFVRGVPKKVLERRDELALVAAYDDKIAMVEEENKRLRKDNKRLLENVEERDEKIARKNKRLCSILDSVKKTLDD